MTTAAMRCHQREYAVKAGTAISQTHSATLATPTPAVIR